jgi:regulator of protease activity HflC (stomatin/prohibitin superfamily)
MLIFLGLSILVVTYFLCGITIIDPNEMGVKVFLGSPRKVIHSGFHFVFPLIERVIRFTTAQEEIELGETKIITAADDNHASAMVKVSLSFRFRWPTDDDLIESVRTFRNFGRDYLKTMLSEAVVDIAEAVGGRMNWRELFRDKQGFEQAVQAEIANLPAESIIRTGRLRNPRILLVQVILPDDLEKAITVPEVRKLEAKGEVAKAEGEKKATILRGEGDAERIKKVYEAIAGPNYQKVGVDLRKVEAIEKLASGPSNVVVSIPEVSEALATAKPLLDKLIPKGNKAGGKADKIGGKMLKGGK